MCKTVKMGGEVPFILRNCPDFKIQNAYRFSGLYNSKGMLIICIGRAPSGGKSKYLLLFILIKFSKRFGFENSFINCQGNIHLSLNFMQPIDVQS